MASYHKQKGGKYQVRWRDRSGVNRALTVPNLDTAKKIKLAAETAAALGQSYHGPQEDSAQVSLEDLAKAYLKDRKRSLKPKSVEQIDEVLVQFLNHLEDLHKGFIGPALLTRETLAEFHRYQTEDRRCSVSTANARVRHIERWWSWLFEEDERSIIPKPRHLSMPTPPASPMPIAPTWAEMDMAARAANGWYKQLFQIMRFTGLRTTQALRLRRSDLDLRALRLTIRGELGKTPQEQRGRQVPLSPHLAELVETWPLSPDGWLLAISEPPTPGRYKQAPAREAVWATGHRIWKRSGARPEIYQTRQYEDGTRQNAHPFHCFRAGFISNLLAAGVDLPDVQYLVGHASRTVTEQRYTDPRLVRKLDAAIAMVPPVSPEYR